MYLGSYAMLLCVADPRLGKETVLGMFDLKLWAKNPTDAGDIDWQ